MQMTLPVFLAIFLIMSTMIIDAKNYNAVELNRIHLKNLYRNQILTRPITNNQSQTIVGLGLGIIEVSGIDPQKQVC